MEILNSILYILGIVFSILIILWTIISCIIDSIPNVKRAQIAAEDTIRKAEQKAKQTIDDANKKSEEILSGAKSDAEKITNDAKKKLEENLSREKELEELNAKAKSEIARYQKLSFELYQTKEEKSNLQNLLSEALKDFSNKKIIFNVEDYLYSVSVGRLGNMINSEINMLSLNVKAFFKAEPENYTTTLNYCTCPDYKKFHKPCKHMFYLTYNFGMLYAQKDNIEKQLKSSILKLDENIKENKKTIKKLEATEKRTQNKKALPKQS